MKSARAVDPTRHNVALRIAGNLESIFSSFQNIPIGEFYFSIKKRMFDTISEK
jgi:hypothetical protein